MAQGRRRGKAAVPEEAEYGSVEACRIANISYRQLDYWDRTDLIKPSVRAAAGSGTSRRYSEADVESLSVVAVLERWGFSLQALRRMAEDNGLEGLRVMAEKLGDILMDELSNLSLTDGTARVSNGMARRRR